MKLKKLLVNDNITASLRKKNMSPKHLNSKPSISKQQN